MQGVHKAEVGFQHEFPPSPLHLPTTLLGKQGRNHWPQTSR